MSAENETLINDGIEPLVDKANPRLNALLDELSGALGPIDDQLSENFCAPEIPPLFLLGNPRSGTTTFMSILQSSGMFAVPTNVLARFSRSPYIGARIQQLLFDSAFDFRDQMQTSAGSTGGRSELGSTRGPLAANEFYHFWRRFFPVQFPSKLSSEEIQAVDVQGLLKGVSAIEAAFGLPFASKAMLLQFDLDHFHELLAPTLYVYLKREPEAVMRSVLEARRRYHGDEAIWWSVRPAEYSQLRELSVAEQIAGQVYYTDKAIREGLQHVPEEYRLTLQFDDMIRSPVELVERIQEKYAALGFKLSVNGNVAAPAEVRQGEYSDDPVSMQLSAAYSALLHGH